MVLEILNELKSIDSKLEGLTEASLSNLADSLTALIGAIPEPASTVELRKVEEDIKDLTKEKPALLQIGSTAPPLAGGPDSTAKLAVLEERKGELVRDFMACEELRVFKKIAEFMMERLVDTVLRTKPSDEEQKLRLLDQAAKILLVQCKPIGRMGIQVEEVANLSEGIFDKSMGVAQIRLQDKIKTSASSYDGKSPGLIELE